jgi:hypothetical protein
MAEPGIGGLIMFLGALSYPVGFVAVQRAALRCGNLDNRLPRCLFPVNLTAWPTEDC